MASETTSTSQAALIATEVIARNAIIAHQPKQVVMRQLHWDSIEDAGTGMKRYPVYSDLGSASGGTEGTALSSNTELTMGTSVTVTPTEGAAVLAVITEKVVKERLGGRSFGSVIDVFQSEDVGMLSQLLAPDITRMTHMILNKIETDCVALLDDASNTVGGGAGVDLRISDLFDALYTMRTLQPLRPPSEWKFLLCPHQIKEVTNEALLTAGGLGGAIWNMQANFNLANRPTDEFAMSGLAGTFLNYNVFEVDHELRLESGSAAKGALWAGGRMDQSPDETGGAVGYGVLLWEQPVRFRFAYDPKERGMVVVGNAIYLAKELANANGVTISSDDA